MKSRVKQKKTSAARSKKLFISQKNIIIPAILLLIVFLTVSQLNQTQQTQQYAQEVYPLPSTTEISPTYACLGTTCEGSIAPTAAPTVSEVVQPTLQPLPTLGLPTNPNGKTPPGQINSAFRRLGNWFKKYMHFGGNPPGNPNIPGTNINPMASQSGARILLISGTPVATDGGVLDATQAARRQEENRNMMGGLIEFFNQLFGKKNRQ